MKYDVEILLRNEDIQSKFELVKIFKKLIIARKSQEDLDAQLFDYLLESDSRHRIKTFDSVRHYGPKRGLECYVANQLFLALNVRSIENKILVLDELNTTLGTLYVSKNPLLKVTKAKRLVDLISNFLGHHFHKITNERFLSIYFVPFENKIHNATFDINTNSIVVFRTKEKEKQTPEYIFLHEFGHILHSRIFKAIDEVPSSFVEFNRKMNPSFTKFSRREKLEIYADLFSIAAMLDTEYEMFNPLIKKIKRVTANKIKEYFISDISTLN